MQPEAMMHLLKNLKLHGMAQAVNNLAEQDSPALQPASPVLAGLLKANWPNGKCARFMPAAVS